MFHENLKALRKDRGLSQEELAARLHVVRQTISKWEKGLSVPDAEMLLRLAEVLDTTVSRLLGTVHPAAGAGHPGRLRGIQYPAHPVQLRGLPLLPGPGPDGDQRPAAGTGRRL